MRKVALAWLLVCSGAHAYIYSVPGMVDKIFSGRRQNVPVEVSLRHQIGESDGILRETIYYGNNRIYILWEEEGNPSSRTLAKVDKDSYRFLGAGRYPRQSSLYLQYLLLREPVYFQASLRRENFVRRDQMMEFKPGYTLEGAPKSWTPNEFYLKHDDIFIQRLDSGEPAVAVTGLNEGLEKRIAYFDRNVLGVRRLEWQTEGRSTSWNFELFKRMPAGGYFPKRITLTQGGVEVIRSQVISAKVIPKKRWASIRKQFSTKREKIPSSVNASLSRLLRYR